MDIYSIYKVTNMVNGKVYIGYTKNIRRRKKSHKSNAINNTETKFYNAVRKYGWDNFQWEIIYQSLDSEYTVSVMESHFINEYDSFHNGYNSTLGGDGGRGMMVSEETRKKLSQIHKGRVFSNQHIDNLKISAKNRKVSTFSESHKEKLREYTKNNNPMNNPEYRKKVSDGLKGKTKSEDHKKKLSQSSIGKVYEKKECPHCNKLFGSNNIQRHIKSCN